MDTSQLRHGTILSQNQILSPPCHFPPLVFVCEMLQGRAIFTAVTELQGKRKRESQF